MKKTFATLAAASLLALLPCVAPGGDTEDRTPGRFVDVTGQTVDIIKSTNGQFVLLAAGNDAETIKARQAAAQQLADLKSVVRGQTGLVDVTPEAVRRLISTLQEQREQLALDDAGAEGRRAALQEAVDQLSKKLDQKVEDNDVIRALQSVVDVRRTQLERIKALIANGAAPQSEKDQVEASLATAIADVAAARQKVLGNASFDALDVWNRQLMEVMISRQERQARLHYIEKRLSALSEALGNLDQIEKLRASADQAHAADLAQWGLYLKEKAFVEGQPTVLLQPATKPTAPSQK